MRPSGWTVALIQWPSQSSSSVRLAMSASSVWWASSSVIVRCAFQTSPASAVARRLPAVVATAARTRRYPNRSKNARHVRASGLRRPFSVSTPQ